MSDVSRRLTVLADGEPFAPDCRLRLSGKTAVGLFPSLFTLEIRNLSEEDLFRLNEAGNLTVMRGDSCLAHGRISDAFRRTVPEGTLTAAAFSFGLDLWKAPVSLSLGAGVSVSETVLRLLNASGTGIQLLSFPGSDPVFSRAQAYCGRAAECVEAALSAVQARAYLVPAGLCVIPADPLPATLHLSEADLTDRPAFAEGGRKMILSTTVTGFQPGEEMTLNLGGRAWSGLILERLTEADTAAGPWMTQLLIDLH